MAKFLNEVASNILKNSSDLSDVCIIIPNRRTELFLKKELFALLNTTSWLPKIITIQNVFESNSKLIVAEDLLLIGKLYKVFKKHTKTEENFDAFYYWGQIILNDFDDIDKYLVDAEKLFTTIKDIGEIDAKFHSIEESELEIIKKFWANIDGSHKSDHKEKFLFLWSKMYDIYIDFRKVLFDEGIAYQGMAYRQLVENINLVNFDKEKYFVLGFNALNKCEKTLLKYLKSNRETKFYWDYDKYYFDNSSHEAARFLRENLRIFGSELNNNNNISQNRPKVEVISVPTPIAQVKLLDKILTNWSKEANFDVENTAIALGNENLLIPLTNSIPNFVGEYNITMGFPLKNSKAFNFIYHLISLRQNSRNYDNSLKFYYKDITVLLNHIYISHFFADEASKILKFINTEKLIFADLEQHLETEFIKMIFSTKPATAIELLNWFSDITSMCLNNISKDEDFIIEAEFLIKIASNINLIIDSFVAGEIEIQKKDVLFKIIYNSLRSLSLAFEGEPLKGLQVLGFLETRNLDFDKVIMLSLNEGVFPKKSSSQTLIPYNLRKFYELPSIEFQDSIFAYYFYRLFQRAKDIKILYSAQGDETSNGEVSRFVSQIKYESGLDIKFTNKAYKISLSENFKILGSKTPEVIEKVKQHLQKGISPSAINTYLSCQFRYYLRYVLGLKEPDKLEEQEDSAAFGSLLHAIMKNLYSPYKNQIFNKDLFKIIRGKESLQKAKVLAIKEVFNLKSESQVKDAESKIIVDIVMKYVSRLLDYDSSNAEFSIINLEEEYSRDLNLNNYNLNVKIKGNIDRVDRQSETLRVIDYKTGSVNKQAEAISDLFAQDRKYDLDILMQVFLYSYILRKDFDFVCPAVFDLNKLGKNYDFKILLTKNEVINFSDENVQDFEACLIEMFQGFIDPNSNFSQTKTSDNCTYCPFKNICQK